MSVARNSSRFAPYYDFKLYNISLRGFESNKTVGYAASPTVAIGFGSVVASLSTTVTNGMWKSTNNIDWSLITTSPNTAIYSVAYGNDTFVAVGAAGTIYTSPGTSGETWTSRTKAGSSPNNFNKVVFVNGLFFAQQQSANIQYSSDGITWAIVGGSTSSIANTPDADQGGSWNPSLIYSKGTYIWFSGNTASTASNRIWWINESSITSTSGVNWSNNAFSTSQAFRFGRQDPGDGLGAFIQSSSGATFNAFAQFTRVNISNISANFQTSSFASTLENIAWGGGIDSPSTSVGVTLQNKANVYNANSTWNGLYYKDGWYTSVFPAVTNVLRFGGQTTQDYYTIGVSRWSETEFVPGTTVENFEDNRTTIFPQYLVTGASISSRFQRVAEWEQGEKKIIVLNGTSFGDQNNQGTIMLVGSRAIRPLRTTISERAR